MKIAFLTNGTSPVPATNGGAVENLIEDLLDENETKSCFEFSVLSLYESKAEEQSRRYKKSQFYFIKCPTFVNFLDKVIYWISKNLLKKKNLISYRFILRRLYVMSKFPSILLNNDFDRIVLVTNSTLFLVLKNRRVAKKYKDKVIYYLHNEVRSLFKCEEQAASIRSFIGISNFVNNAFRKQVPSLKEEQCFILRNGVDTEKFLARDELKIEKYKKMFGISEEDFVVIFAGRLVSEKGALETIKAIKACNDEGIKLLIVGASFYSSDVIDEYSLVLKKEAETIRNRIIFTGYIDYEDMPSIYHLGDIALLPSMWEEPAGMTMVEAAIAGTLLITTKSGGIPEYIPDNAAIFLERDGKLVENITKAILKVKEDPSKYDSMRKKGMQLADRYNLDNFYNNFKRILME